MSKYTEEFKRNAIEPMKKAGITKACKELNISHCTLYRWCMEMEGKTVVEAEELADGDLDAMMGEHTDESAQETESATPSAAEDESSGNSDTIATAIAMLVIEYTHLREIIQHLRDTIAGLTDHRLLQSRCDVIHGAASFNQQFNDKRHCRM